jgi:NAD(P)-dependent dehydrogenase (short-subunit alcohol dehydrogenase family)
MKKPTLDKSKTKASRTAIVTGGAGAGIGHGITEALIADGWSVLVVDRDARAAAKLSKNLRSQGYPVEALVADLTAPSTPRRAVSTAIRAFGRIDALVNNAGVGLCKPIAKVSDAEFNRLLDVDLRAAFRMTREVIPAMNRAGGAIVNIGSVHAHQTIAGYGIYAAIKSALEGFTRGIAVDYGPRNIRANCVHPGYVESPQNRALIRRFTKDVDGWIARYAASKQLLPQIVTPQHVGELVAWLLGDKSVTVTGQSIVVDSGTTTLLFEREGKT